MLIGKKTLGTIGLMSGNPFCHQEFCWSLAQMIQFNTEYVCQHGQVIHLVRADMTYHAAARNDLVKQMLGDWLLMLDLDHGFAPDMLARMLLLLNRHDIDVLTAMYHARLPPHAPLIHYWNEKHTGFQQVSDWDTRAAIFPVDAAGGGSLLVRRSVYERVYNELGEEPFSVIPPFSEDYSFFVRLEKLGIKAYCAPHVQSAHLMTKPVTSEDYVERMSEIAVAHEVEART